MKLAASKLPIKTRFLALEEPQHQAPASRQERTPAEVN